jgi:trehalose 6-phosphate phosphatase
MRWLWSRWPDVEERIQGAGCALLLLDFDGTVAPIAPVPDEATLPRNTKSILRRISRSRRTTLAVVSGRTVADLRRLVGLRKVTYIGNHGLETWWNGRHSEVTVPRFSRQAMVRLRPRLESLLTDFRGALMEDKRSSICVHYRLVNARRAALLKAAIRREVIPFKQSGGLKLMGGKRILEIRPNLRWTKGDACLALMRQMRRRPVLPIYIGDDRTDEDAFEALSSGVTIRVGLHRRSRATYYVRNIGEVITFLEWMAQHL